MGEPDFVSQFNSVTTPHTHRGRRPFTHSVHRQNCGLFERRREKSTRRVGFMVFRKDESSRILIPQTFSYFAGHVEFLPQPDRHRFAKRSIPERRPRKIGFQQTLEFPKRLVVEADIVQLLGRQSGLCQAVIDGMLRKSVVVLPAGKPFLLRSCNQFSVDD